jgi:isoquinoline 1-oxidoreductase alpha subunit
MAVAAFLKTTPAPTDAEIDQSVTNICRCATYVRIRRAIHRAAALMRARPGNASPPATTPYLAR